ncbi:MAG: HisA/HisF-related TIM barrel protein, partial [Candidatus Omnitrophota bacterium]
MNTSAVKDPSLVRRASRRFGSQCVVVAIDAKSRARNKWEVYVNGGRTPTGIDAVEWGRKAERLGAGEILLTSMDKDGTRDGYDTGLTRAFSENLNIPIIASGGAGGPGHMFEVLKDGKADAVLAASIFHYREYSVREVKRYLNNKGIKVRI